MSSSVLRRPAPDARSSLSVYYVTRYDPKTFRAVGDTVPVEAQTKVQAAEQVCGFLVEAAAVKAATISVICIGEPQRERQYFRRA